MMSQIVTDLCTTKYSSLLEWGAEQFPFFWKCCNPSKQWNLLTQRYRIQLIIFKCKYLLFSCTIFVWHVHTLSIYRLTNKTKNWCWDANIISWGWHNNSMHSCSFICGYYNNLFSNVHYTISQRKKLYIYVYISMYIYSYIYTSIYIYIYIYI